MSSDGFSAKNVPHRRTSSLSSPSEENLDSGEKSRAGSVPFASWEEVVAIADELDPRFAGSPSSPRERDFDRRSGSRWRGETLTARRESSTSGGCSRTEG